MSCNSTTIEGGRLTGLVHEMVRLIYIYIYMQLEENDPNKYQLALTGSYCLNAVYCCIDDPGGVVHYINVKVARSTHYIQ